MVEKHSARFMSLMAQNGSMLYMEHGAEVRRPVL